MYKILSYLFLRLFPSYRSSTRSALIVYSPIPLRNWTFCRWTCDFLFHIFGFRFYVLFILSLLMEIVSLWWQLTAHPTVGGSLCRGVAATKVKNVCMMEFLAKKKGKLVICDVRFLGCSSSLTLTKGAAFCWINRQIMNGMIRITGGLNGTKDP